METGKNDLIAESEFVHEDTRLVNIGDYVKDTVTEFKGTITKYMIHDRGGEDRVLVEAKVGTDNRPIEPQWFDVSRLKKLTTTSNTFQESDTLQKIIDINTQP